MGTLKKLTNLDPIKKILFFKIGSIGDTLMTTPLVHTIRNAFPDSTIEYFIGDQSSQVLMNNPDIDEVISFPEQIFYEKKILSLAKLRGRIRDGSYHLGFALDKHWAISFFLKSCNIGILSGFNRNGNGKRYDYAIEYNNTDHEIDQYLRLSKPFIKDKINKIPPFLKPSALPDCVNDVVSNDFLLVFPGGGNNLGVGDEPVRRMPHTIFSSIIKKLPSEYDVVFAGDENDGRIVQRIRHEVNGRKTYDFTGMTSISETAELCRLSSCVLCHDSGPMHIASTQSKRMMAFFGPTNPLRKAPRHLKTVAFWKHDDEKKYDPNYEYLGKKPQNTFFSSIDPDEVITMLHTLLSDRSDQSYLKIIQ